MLHSHAMLVKSAIVLVALLSISTRAAADEVEFSQDIEPLLQRYCFDCHDAEAKTADVDLTRVGSQQEVLQDRQVWRTAWEVVESSRMPPEGELQPSVEERELLSRWIHQALNDVDWEQVRSPGRVPLARLTRVEYQHTVEDLFGIPVSVSDLLPEDPEGLSGFANDRTSMVMTGKQLEAYFQAAARVADTVMDAWRPQVDVIRYEVETGENANYRKEVTRRDDGSVGWTFTSALGQKYQSVRKPIDFPRSGRYRVRVRAASTGPGPAAGMWIAADSVNDASREAGVLVEGKGPAIYETEMFLTAGRHDLLFGYDFYRPMWLPEVPTRPQMKLGQSTFDPPPYDHEALVPDGVTWQELIELNGPPPAEDEEGIRERMRLVNRLYYREVLDRLMRDKFHYSKGYLPVFVGGLGYDYQTHVVPALDEMAESLDVSRKVLEQLWKSHETPLFRELEEFSDKQRAAWGEQDQSRKAAVGGLFVDWIEFEPLAAPSDSLALPEDESQLDHFLTELLPRALRRSVSEDQQRRYRAIYLDERDSGAGHEEALHRLLIAVLVSPEFLYRAEGHATADVEPLDGDAMASRLSYFLWSSMPDDSLFEAARQGHLQDEDELGRQVDRMLRDDRASRFAQQFSTQWLNLSGIGREKEPDKELFRYFSWHLAEDMRQEVSLMLERLVRDDRSILELLDSDEAFLNERLARLYGIDDVTGGELRPVALSDPHRGGLLGTAAVLTTTSLATRTSPVRRGAFVVETLLGIEMPPPPPGVGDLPDDAGQSETRSLRETLVAHRDNSRCAGCHNKIDPPGFALENFDWIGRWRAKDPAGPVDARGQLPDGTELHGPDELKTYLIETRKDDFTRALTEGVLAYALGRELKYFDEHAIRGIVAAVGEDDYRARTLIQEVAMSYPFRYRVGE